jgi:hypothetical protein
MPRWFIRTGCGEQADLAGGDRASAVGSRSGRSTSFESAWPRPRSRHKLLDPVPRMRGSIHDWPARRVVCGVSARVSLECTPCGFVIAFDGIRSCARSPNITILYKVLPALFQKDNESYKKIMRASAALMLEGNGAAVCVGLGSALCQVVQGRCGGPSDLG